MHDHRIESDKPIENIDEDLFHRELFIKTLYSAIKEIDDTESIVIGLSGSWGVGKSSIINMVCSMLDDDRANGLHPRDTIVVRFNPWNLIEPDRNSEYRFILAFFEAIRDQLVQDKNDGFLDSEKVEKLSEAFASYISLIQPGFVKATASALLNHFTDEALSKRGTISGAKEQIKNALGDFGVKVLVVIDDVDRLSKTQICTIFQLITTIADFKSVNYLIAYDREVVEKAVADIQNISGNEYLEKIIQVPIHVPEPAKAAMAVVIDDQFGYIVKNYYKNADEAVIRGRFGSLLTLLHQGISTMREVIRLKNALRFKLPILKDHIDAMDIVALELLRVKDPSILRWLNQQRDILLLNGEPNEPIKEISSLDREELETEIDKCWDTSGKSNHITRMAIDFLFGLPRDYYERDKARTSRAQLDKRVLDQELFELYLTSDIDSAVLQADLIDYMIRSANAKGLTDFITDTAKSGKYLYAIEIIASIDASSSAESSESIATAIANTIHFVNQSTARDAECTRAIDVFETAISSIPEPERSKIVEDVFSGIPGENTICMAEFIFHQECAYERHGLSGNDKKLIDEQALDRTEGCFSLSMSYAAADGSLIRFPSLRLQATLWKKVDKDTFSAFANNPESNLTALVILVEAFLGTWHPLGQSEIASYSIHEELFAYATKDALQEAIKRIVDNATLWDIPFGTQRKVAALNVGLLRGGGTGPYDEITVEEADAQLDEWQAEYEKDTSLGTIDFDD